MKSINLVSIIVPIHNEEKNIVLLIEKIFEVMNKLPVNFEIILINDGSIDQSWKVLQKLSGKYLNLRA